MNNNGRPQLLGHNLFLFQHWGLTQNEVVPLCWMQHVVGLVFAAYKEWKKTNPSSNNRPQQVGTRSRSQYSS